MKSLRVISDAVALSQLLTVTPGDTGPWSVQSVAVMVAVSAARFTD